MNDKNDNVSQEVRMDTKTYIEQAEKVLMYTYKRFQIVLDKGDGVHLYDLDGREYLDFASGIGVFALGYGNKKLNEALKKQIDKLLHTSNYYYNIPSIEAAQKFTNASGMDQVFFSNSGTEAVEGAIKLARKYYYKRKGKADSEIIAMNHSFHGRSMGALSITGTKKYREAFEPLIGGVLFAEYNNLDSVKKLVKENTCGIIVEPIQGEGGINPAKKEFLAGLRKLCDEKDILLIFDEIQCGMGRSGKMFAYQDYGILPDIMTSAKALGCGVPVGVFAAVNKVAGKIEPGDHGSTYGGNPFVTTAISKVFDLFEEEKVLENVNQVASYLEEQLDKLVKDYDFIKERRGKGLMQGLEFNKPVGELILKAMDQGLILINAGANVLRFLPPLTISKKNVDDMIVILKKCL